MKLSLDALLVLDSIDRKGSFAAAADYLHRVPSAITYAIQKLEQDLNVTLFDRTGHKAKLTPIGLALLEEGRDLLETAFQLENRIHRLSTGWESELRIAFCDLIPFSRFIPLIRAFEELKTGTRLRFSREVLGGTWDALAGNRADLVVGASGEGLLGPLSKRMGQVLFLFACAPEHPLTSLPQPIPATELKRHRIIAAADSSRHLPAKSAGLISGYEVLTVPSMADKIELQCAGLGVGFLPVELARPFLEQGRLVELQVCVEKPEAPVSLAWKEAQPGLALKWFIEHCMQTEVCAALLGDLQP